MTCLDTDFIISVLRGEKNALIKLEEMEKRQEILSITSISAAELLKGAYNSREPKKEVPKIIAYLNSLNVLEFDVECANIFARIWYNLKKDGTMISEFDILVASTVIRNDETLLTKNIKHFEKIPELRINTW